MSRVLCLHALGHIKRVLPTKNIPSIWSYSSTNSTWYGLCRKLLSQRLEYTFLCLPAVAYARLLYYCPHSLLVYDTCISLFVPLGRLNTFDIVWVASSQRTSEYKDTRVPDPQNGNAGRVGSDRVKGLKIENWRVSVLGRYTRLGRVPGGYLEGRRGALLALW